MLMLQRTTTLPPLLGTSHPTTHPCEMVRGNHRQNICVLYASIVQDSLKHEINVESKLEWLENVRPSTPPHNSFKMNMRAYARRATAQKARLAKTEDPKEVTSRRCYDKEHQRRPSSLTEWTWDEHDSNMPCEAYSQPEEQGVAYLVRQCLKIADENTLWLLNSQPGDHDRQVAYDRANHAMPLPADGGAPVNLLPKELSPVTLDPLKLASWPRWSWSISDALVRPAHIQQSIECDSGAASWHGSPSR